MTAIANNRAENLGFNLPANVCSTRSLVISALALVVIGMLVVSCLSLFKYHFLPPVAAGRMLIIALIFTAFKSCYATNKCLEAICGREEQHRVDIVRRFTQAEVQQMFAEINAQHGSESAPSKPVTFEPTPGEDYDCSLCLEDKSSTAPAYSHVAVAGVVHRFCKECFEGWMNSQPTDPLKCPKCRDPLIRPTIQN